MLAADVPGCLMGERLHSWRMVRHGEPLVRTDDLLPEPRPGEALLEVRACGVCHTDVGFLYDGVRPNAQLPLTLGHEIVGDAIAVGEGAEQLLGGTFVVPAVLPCGECELCRRGRGNICRRQKMPGNDFHGGFASHFLAPGRFLCRVPEGLEPVEELAVTADAVATAYQAVVRADLSEGDMVVVVGAGGVGTFAIQAAKARGTRVAAIDVDARRLEALEEFLDLALDASEFDALAIRRAVADFEASHDVPHHGRKILECSGVAAGQETAYALLTHDAVLMVVGFTREKVSVRLSNLMAFDARAIGNWGCLPDHFPEILRLIAAGEIQVTPFVERHPMSRVNEILLAKPGRRPVMIPDFE